MQFQTKILTSVKSFKETSLVSLYNVDIIDFKDPDKGALGAMPIEKIKSCLKILPSSQETSATIGDIDNTDGIEAKVIKLSKINIDFIKVGIFFNENKLYKLSNIKNLIRKNKKLIAVIFADYNYSCQIVKKIKEANFDGILIDTANKKRGNLRYFMSKKKIKNFINISKKNKLSIGLAGSLKISDINPLLKLQPDYIGFRSALCSGYKRDLDICQKSLNEVTIKFKKNLFKIAI